jgi:hypothetical protein
MFFRKKNGANQDGVQDGAAQTAGGAVPDAIKELDYPEIEPAPPQDEPAPPKPARPSLAEHYAKTRPEAERQPPPDERERVLSIFHIIGFLFVMAIPIVNIILAFRWGFSRYTNRNLRNLSLAVLFYFLLGIVIYAYLLFVR